MNARNILVPFLVLVIATSGLTACSSAPNKEAAAAATVAAARSTEAAAEATKAAAAQIIAQTTAAVQGSSVGTPTTHATQRPILTAATAPTQTAIRTATIAPTQTPPPVTGTAEPQGQKFYLNANSALALTPPPSNSQSHTECLSECTLTWAITLTQPLQGNAYAYRLVNISGSYDIRLLHTRGDRQTVLAEWLNRSGWQGGPQLDALPGDVLTLEITTALGAVFRPKTLPVAAGSLLAYDYGSYSYVTVGVTPTPLPTFAPPPKPTPARLDTSAAVQIHYGDVITQEIKPSGNVDTYIFDGKAGDIAVIVAAGATDAPWLSLKIQVFDSEGQPVGNESYGNGEFELAADGRYTFTVRESGTRVGPYNVTLKNAAPGAGARIAYGDVVEEEIAVAGETDVYSFAGKAGDEVLIALSNRPLDNSMGEFVVVLLDPPGNSVQGSDAWVGNTSIIAQTLTVDGIHDIRVWMTGQLDSPRTGAYTLLLKDTSRAKATRLGYGTTISEAIRPAGDNDVYLFEWKPGEEPVIGMRKGQDCSFAEMSVEVLDSVGNSLALGSDSFGTFDTQVKPSLTEAGIYEVVVKEVPEIGSYYTCSYTLSLKNLAAP